MPSVPSPLYTIKDLSDYLKVSPKTLYFWVSGKRIPYIKVGRHVRFKPEEIMEFFESITQSNTGVCHLSQSSVKRSVRSSLTIGKRRTAEVAPSNMKE